jgi:DNA transformation protein
MARKPDRFVEHVLGDVLAGLPGLRARSMFGGHGLYAGSVFFGIIAEGTLYFKVDEHNRAMMSAAGGEPFSYAAKDKTEVSLGYLSVPEEILERPEEAVRWAESAIAVAKRAKAK